jgi:hypothetical protein
MTALRRERESFTRHLADMRRRHDIGHGQQTISTKTSVSREARGECVDILEVIVPNRNVVTCELLKYRRVRG